MEPIVWSAWSTLIGFLIFKTILLLPVLSWIFMGALICWLFDRSVIHVIEERIVAFKQSGAGPA